MSVASDIRTLAVRTAREREDGYTRTVRLTPSLFLDLVNEIGTIAFRAGEHLDFEGCSIELDHDFYGELDPEPYLVLSKTVHL